MSGGTVSYNLRPNKFVERQLFIELLAKVCGAKLSDDYAYISLGGPQLEDHRLVHQILGVKALVSLETDSCVFGRQMFNRRPSFVDCRNVSMGDFVTNFDAFCEEEKYKDKKFIVWLDYASARERRQQIAEYQTLLGKLQEQDILKITLNSNPATLGERQNGETVEEVEKRRLQTLQTQLEDYLPSSVTSKDMSGSNLASVLSKVIQLATERAISTSKRKRLTPVPLAIYLYQDSNHLMLTATVRITETSQLSVFKSGLQWEDLPSDWSDIKRINIPNLTAKERLYIESLLFSENHEAIHQSLPFRFDKDEDASLRIFVEYAKHYRRYPSYFQVAL